jgi:DNA polymerase-3 subunit delta'
MPLSTIVGHAPVIRLLRHAVRRGRVPQSLIFAGPEGVGKRAVAIALAQAVNCPRRSDGDACGACTTCGRIARGQHSDVMLIDRGGEASIKIKVLRERLLDTSSYRPFEAERRVFIIDPADAMTPEAQDSLLKTLEEPPSASIIILITAYPDTLQATIRSRCRRLRFAPLAEADVARVLVAQGIVTDAAAARRLAARSGGSVSQALAADGGDFDADRDAALAVLTAAKTRGVTGRLKAAAALARHDSDRRDREAMADRLAILLALLRDVCALKTSDTIAVTHADLADRLRPLTASFDIDRLTDAFAVIESAEDALGRNASPKLVADWVAVTV